MRETVLHISQTRLQHNLDIFKQLIHPNTRILANLKGNAYGSDAVLIGKYLEKKGASYFSVAYINEGINLRKHGIKTNLIVFNPSTEHFEPLLTYRLEPEVSSLSYLKKLVSYLQKKNIHNFKVHIKLDTGMHRAGISFDELPKLIDSINAQNNMVVKSVFSHLAAAEDPNEDDFTRQQIQNFEQMTRNIKANTKQDFFRHLLNTAGIFRFPEAQYDMIRPGLGIFGYNLVKSKQGVLQPINQLVTKINQIKHLKKGESVGYNRNFTALKNTTIALLPIGYADGLNRQLGQQKWQVHINGQQAPIIGNVSMDTISIDVTQINCQQGDEVIIFNNTKDVYKMASILNTIPYEITANITQRVPRTMI